MEDRPQWLEEAYKRLGKRSTHESVASDSGFWRRVTLNSISNDNIAWAAAFVGAALDEAGVTASRSGVAMSYMRWGFAIHRAALGCIAVVLSNDSPHVGFVVGSDGAGSILLLAANTNLSVTVKRYPVKSVLGYRWPSFDYKQRPIRALD